MKVVVLEHCLGHPWRSKYRLGRKRSCSVVSGCRGRERVCMHCPWFCSHVWGSCLQQSVHLGLVLWPLQWWVRGKGDHHLYSIKSMFSMQVALASISDSNYYVRQLSWSSLQGLAESLQNCNNTMACTQFCDLLSTFANNNYYRAIVMDIAKRLP